MCFQVIGVDILIDAKFKPYLLELNASPSFGTDSSLDYKIKKNVLTDTFKLLNFSYKKRKQLIKEEHEKIFDRIMTGKVHKLDAEQREKLRQEKLLERFQFESTRMRGFELIYPSSDSARNQVY